MRWWIVFLSLGLGLLSPTAARAHAVLLESTPADGAVLAEGPATLHLRFSEHVVPIAVTLLAGNGDIVPGSLAVADATLTLTLPAALAPGFHILSWRVTSADSHPVAGSITFLVGTGTFVPRAAPPPTNRLWALAATANRAAFLAGTLIACGGFLFILVFGGAPPAARLVRALRAAALAGIATALLGIGLQGGVLPGGDANLLGAPVWQLSLASSRGHALAAAAAALVMVVAALAPRPGPARTMAGLLGTCATAATFALSGHAATAHPDWLAGPAVVLHVALAAAWLGALLPLCAGLSHSGAQGQLTAFSRLALPAVLPLVLAGSTLAALQVQRPAGLTTAYGQLLLAKIALVAAMLGLAALNRFVLVPRLPAQPERAARLLRLCIGGELACGLAVLAMTSWLSQSVPPRATALIPPHGLGYAQILQVGARTMRIAATPARPGTNSITVTLAEADGRPLVPRGVTVELSLPDAGIEPIRRALRRDRDNAFVYTGSDLTFEGAWSLRVEVLVSDFELVATTAELHIH